MRKGYGPICHKNLLEYMDQGLVTCKLVGYWMTNISVIDISTKYKGKMLPSQKCSNDVESCIFVFLNVCFIQTLKERGITPSRLNLDLADNIFC